MPSERVLFDSTLIRIGHFVCAPDEPEWSVENVINGTVAVFPTVPVRIEQAGHESVVADRTVVMYYNDGQPYRRTLLHRRGDDAVWIAFKGGLAGSLMAEFRPGDVDRLDKPFDRPRGPSPSGCYLRHRALAEFLGRETPHDSLAIEEAALSLTRELFQADVHARGERHRSVRTETERSRRQIAEDVRQLLATDPGHAWSLDTLVDRVCISPGHLCKIFKEQLGTTIHQHLTDLRLREAAHAVLDGERDLTGLALRVGFSTHSHFSCAFRHAFGLPPSQLRDPGRVDQLALAHAAA
jgi:AraC family transcriptional regulator